FTDIKIAILKDTDNYNNVQTLIDSAKKASNCIKIFAFNNTSNKLLKSLNNLPQVLILKEDKKSYKDTIKFIIDEFNKLNLPIDYNSAREIYELIGTNENILKNEIEKLYLYFYNKKTVEKNDIFRALYFSGGNLAFKFIDAFMLKDKKKTIKLFDDLKATKTNMDMIFYMLIKRFKKILLYKVSPEYIKDHSFIKRKIADASKLWDIQRLKLLQDKFLEYDHKLKHSNSKAEHFIFLLINTI
ncbi:MAG: hypothetical protein SVN78_01505, partial [Deferribacterota bacterium]|nr:hypothetical protein [Deferribacterota bacterium]